MAKVCPDTIDILMQLALKHFNVLITGKHGVGKSEIVMQIAARIDEARKAAIKASFDLENLEGAALRTAKAKLKEAMASFKPTKVKYYSCATLDPWVDLVGIPVPDTKNPGTLTFCRPKDLMDADWIIFDEINRSHPKVQNACLELVKEKSINGDKFPHLKMVWGIQNPPSKEYQVNPLDPPMITRFDSRITLEGKPSAEFFESRGIDPKVAEAVVTWYEEELSEEYKDRVPPRVLEQICRLICAKVDWKFALGEDLGFPLYQLEHRLEQSCGISKYEGLTLRRINQNLEKNAELVQSDRQFALHVVQEAHKAKAVTCWDAAEVFVALPDEFKMKLFTDDKFNYKMLNHWSSLDDSFHECEDCQAIYQALQEASEEDSQ